MSKYNTGDMINMLNILFAEYELIYIHQNESTYVIMNKEYAHIRKI